MAYPGGKNGAGVYQKIINLLPPHTNYIEPFLGEGAILKNKRPALHSLGLDLDPVVIERWQSRPLPAGVIVRHGDALAVLAAGGFDRDTLIYLDPPYVMSTRSCQRPLYNFEFSDDQHVRLLDLARRLPCHVAISGYYSEMYANALAGWECVTFEAMTRGGTMALEHLWMNYPRPLALHDYKFLGDDFRERERIGRKRKRWAARFARLPILERQAMLWAVQEMEAAAPATNGDGCR